MGELKENPFGKGANTKRDRLKKKHVQRAGRKKGLKEEPFPS